jgi:hypothetical protein
MGNTLPKLHQVIRIACNSGPNATYRTIITSSNAYHKATKWFSHHMNDLVLFRRYTLELRHFGIKCTYSLLAPRYHWRGMYAQV